MIDQKEVTPWWTSFKRKLSTTTRPETHPHHLQKLKFSRPIVEFESLRNVLRAQRNNTQEAVKVEDTSDTKPSNNVSWVAEMTPNRENYPLHLPDNDGHSQPSWRQSDSMMGNRETQRYYIIVGRDLDDRSLVFLRTPATETFIAGSVFNIRGGVGSPGSHQTNRNPLQHPGDDEAARPTEPSFLKSPFLYTPPAQPDLMAAGEINSEQKQDLLSRVLSEILQEKVRPAGNTNTRGLLTLLSLLSLAEDEEESEALDPSLYQTKFHENTRTPSTSGSVTVSARATEKPYFHTVDVVLSGGGGISQERNTPQYQARPHRQFDVPSVRLSGRSGGVGGDGGLGGPGGPGGVERVSSPPPYYPQSVSWTPPQEIPTLLTGADRLQTVKESAEKVNINSRKLYEWSSTDFKMFMGFFFSHNHNLVQIDPNPTNKTSLTVTL